MRTSILSVHSHADRSFLDDRELALLSGDLRAAGWDQRWVVALVEGPDDLNALADAIADREVVFFERIWDEELIRALQARLPNVHWVHLSGEHALRDPPCDYVCGGEPRDTALALLRYLEEGGPLPGKVAERRKGTWEWGLSAKPAARAEHSFQPDLHPTVIGALPAHPSFSIQGNRGCPYQEDARDNPLYEGTALPEGVGRGCAFCVTGNHYEATPHRETAARVADELAYVRTHARARTRLVLKDQNPFAYLPRVLEAIRQRELGGFKLMLETRADWFLAAGARLEEALRIAELADVRIAPFLVGIENFSQDELDRMNKGVEAATLERFLRELREWSHRFPAMDLTEAAFGFVLFTPWTTLRDLRLNFDAVRRSDLSEFRGHFLLSRARLYPDTALYYLAARDGLLTGEALPSWDDSSARYGYFPAAPWTFANADVAAFASCATRALELLDGRDELRLWEEMLRAFEVGERPSPEALAARIRSTASSPKKRRHRGGSEVHATLPGRCGLRCAVCECHHAQPTKPSELSNPGRRIVLRGGARSFRDLDPLLQRATELGFDTIALRTHGLAFQTQNAARALLRRGVDTVILPLFSERARVHDAIAGVSGAHQGTRNAAQMLHREGVRIELEVPLLAPHLQDLGAILRQSSFVAAVRFLIPRHSVPDRVAPPPMNVITERLQEALRVAGELDIEAPFDNPSGVPGCALPPAARYFGPRRPRLEGAAQLSVCGTCAEAPRCVGLPQAYRDHHGEAGVVPLTKKTRAGERWDDARREAARTVSMLVLRPTVHCNQDCDFCSANETSKNVWEDSRAMMGAIVRAAQRGVDRVSFSGGEPTLHRDLPAFVEVAQRSGVRTIELVTNAVLLAKPGRVQTLVDAGLTHAFVSLHGHDEALSRAQTGKIGDFARTTQGIENLVEAGVVTVINHVINARNYAHLVRFVRLVHARYAGRTKISLAFVTPQYRALDHAHLMPRITDVWPYLRAALHEAVRLGQPVAVGSRQGIPPCLLGEFEAWSDLIHVTSESRAEDAMQKERGEACDRCRYAKWCTGLWKPYVERYGTGELSPIGTPWTDEDLERARRVPLKAPWGVHLSFEEVAPFWRYPDLEAEGAALKPAPPPQRALPVLRRETGRETRVGMIGSGHRARRLLDALQTTEELRLAAIASPHVREATLAIGGTPRFASATELADETRPDAIVIASSTESHAEVLQAVLREGVTVLVEKPIAPSAEDAEAMLRDATESQARLIPAHNLVHTPGLKVVLAEEGDVSVHRRVPPSAPDAPARWSRTSVFQTLYHLVSILVRSGIQGTPRIEARWEGTDRPRTIRATFTGDDARGMLVWELGKDDRLLVTRGAHRLLREGASTLLDDEPQSGSDVDAMLVDFRDAARFGTAPWVPASDGPRTLRWTQGLLDALEGPWDKSAPRRVRSRGMRRGE
ncbi:MAG: radical SAM protein [Myxococcota bacterium]